MLVFWKARLAVLAVPKTGSTALEDALSGGADASFLNPPGLKHCPVRRYHREVAPLFEKPGRKLALMAVMREPVAWLESWYRYRARAEIRGRATSTDGISFEEFVEAWLSEDPPEFARVGRQSRFLNAQGTRVGVHHLFRHDRMETAIAFLENRLQRQITLGRANVSTMPAPQVDARTRARLEEKAPEEFTLWAALCAGDVTLAGAAP